MALAAGTRLGTYEIVALLGAGGMGEVYRARDATLGRDVAIKILPAAFTSDPERLARFAREARVLASLNHSNIGAIYGLEDSGGIRGIVLELVEGDTLAERLARAPRGLLVKEALAIARQIADALDAAHETGVVHRDLKPANIKITPSGMVKVLDFGLAKPALDERQVDLSQSPTVAASGTREGVILGTAAYMSPEQACGKPVDKRTDIWAFGCVLYEMLTGRSPFAGDSFADTAARILERQPDWTALPPSLPATIIRLLERCLQKEARQRLRDIADARVEIDDALSASGPSTMAPSRSARSVTRLSIAALAGAVVVAAGYAAWRRGAGPAPTAPPRYTFSQLTAEPGAEWFASLSPDGKWIVYSGQTLGNRDIYLRGVGGQNPINLTAEFPEDDDQPAFSPDGERIAFRSSRQGGGIFVMGRTGEAPRRLTRAGYRPAWSPDGTTIVYSTESVDVNPQNGYGASGLWLVDVASGQARDLNVKNGAQAGFSPDGKRLAVTARYSDARQMDILTVPVAGGDTTTVVTGPATDWNPVWSPDGRFLYYSSDRGGSMNLWSVPIDMASGQATGEAIAVTTPSPFAAHPSISSDGKLMAFSSVSNTTNVARLTLDPSSAEVRGEPTDVTTGSRPWSSPDPSTDGQWITFYSRLNPEGDVYVARTDGTGVRQLTSDAAIDRVPRWSPNGNWIAFFSNRSGPYALWKVHADGSGLQAMTDAASVYPTWSPDGTRMAGSAYSLNDDSMRKVYVFDTNRSWTAQTPDVLPAFPLKHAAFVPNSWSPDGQSLAGQNSLRPEGISIYSFRSRTFDVLTDFGEFPVWLPDSRRILFVAGGRDFQVIDTATRQIRKIYTASRGVLGPPRLTRDGRTAYFTRRMTESDIWLMKIE